MRNVIEVKTWNECIACIESIRNEHPSQAGNLLFRGHSNSDWKLESTLERYVQSALSFIDYYRLVLRIRPQIETEAGVIWDVPEFSDISSWARQYDQNHYGMLAYEYLAHLRHNGFPSPLLDWSRSPYVAAYFAFSGARGTRSVAIYVFLEAPDGIKVGGNGVPTIRKLGPYVRTHRRHFRQQSTYTVCANCINDDFDGSCAWRFITHEDIFDSELPTRQDLLWKIVLPSKERKKVLSLLDEFNLNAYSLFGSEESLMETLAFREIDLKPLCY